MQTNYANALCHLNAMPLSVAVLAPCAWDGNLACGVAWQSVVNLATHSTATNSVWQNGVCGQNNARRHSKFSTEEMGRCLGGRFLSLIARTFWQAFGLNLKNFSHTQILKHKFKFFIQNSRHFVNSAHFITLTQISSLTQGFFIFLPQIFIQFLLIKDVK